MFGHLVRACLIAFLLAWVSAAGASDLAPAAVDPGPPTGLLTIRKQVEEVQVAFTVRDARGRLVPGMARGDVAVWNDGQPVTALTVFQRRDDLPLRLAVLVDTSDSMQRGFAAELEAAQAFLERVLRPQVDEALVMGFATETERREIQPGNPRLIAAALRGFQPGGQTALYDALYEASRQELMEKHEGQPVRRVIILLSDGEDNYSRHSLGEAIEMAQQAEIAIYAVTAHSRRLEFAGDRVLERLAEATGGRSFVLDKFEKTPQVFATIEDELRAQYMVGFRPPAATGGFHTVKIAAGDAKLRVQARSGYYVSGR